MLLQPFLSKVDLVVNAARVDSSVPDDTNYLTPGIYHCRPGWVVRIITLRKRP